MPTGLLGWRGDDLLARYGLCHLRLLLLVMRDAGWRILRPVPALSLS